MALANLNTRTGLANTIYLPNVYDRDLPTNNSIIKPYTYLYGSGQP
jgi:hypothetical protein